MKKSILLTGTGMLISSLALAQVGINTPTPASTLDITAKNPVGTTGNVDGLLIPRVDRQRAQSMTGVPISTMIYVSNIATGTAAGTAVNIDATGYYFYDGTVWAKLKTPAVNIYNSDGTLTGNRVVAQGANTLAFTGSTVNAFSVDGGTLSVDAANHRIGIGIGATAPVAKLHLNGNQYMNAALTGSTTTNALDINIGQDGFGYGNRTDNYGINMKSLSSVGGGSIARINFGDNNPTTATGLKYLSFSVGNPTLTELMYLTSANNGTVGIATSTPQKTFHVNGSFQVVGEFNVGGSGTAAGSAGTTGQILTSNGAGAAPSWQVPAAVSSVNIYNANGILTGNRIVTQGANTLAFTGTAINAFSVDATTVSVDAVNHRTGFGTATPQKTVHINGALQVANELNVGGNATTAGSAGTTGQILTSNGAGAAPSWQAVPTSPSVNIYNSDGTLAGNRTVTQGANTLAFTGTSVNAFSVAGNSLSVDAAGGRVGFGTTAPGGRLHMYNPTGGNEIGNDYLFDDESDISLTQGLLIRRSNSGSNLAFNAFIGGVNFVPKFNGTFGYGGSGMVGIYRGNGTNNLTALAFRINSNAEAMRLDELGNVGVGTSTPQKKLHVNGSLQVTNEFNVGGTDTTAGSAGALGQILTSNGTGVAPTWQTPAAAGSVNIYNTNGTLTGNRVVTQAANTLAFTGTSINAFNVAANTLSVDAANSRVGLGTTTPAEKLDVSGAVAYSGSVASIKTAAGSIDYNLGGSRIISWGPNATTSGYTAFWSGVGGGAATEFMRLASNGNFGVGTATPQKTVHVNGSLQVTNEFNVGGNGATAGSAGALGQILTSNGTGVAPTWQTPAAAGSVNIYNTNGTLTGNRVVTQAANTLAFTGTSINAFNVAANTLSVDAANSRVGLGTTTPAEKLDVSGAVAYSGSVASIKTAAGSIDYNSGGSRIISWGPNATTSGYTAFWSGVGGGAATEKMRLASNGNLGVGTAAPTAQLHTTSTVRLQGYPSYNLIGTDAGGNLVNGDAGLDNLGIPRPAVFQLPSNLDSFLTAGGIGDSQAVPMAIIANYTGSNGVTYNAAASTITFQPGLYQMTFTYEGGHDSPGCTLSSHFVDFPIDGGANRIHSTASHNQGGTSNYGGNVVYTTKLTTARTWQIQLGRGQSGNCIGPGMTLRGGSTQLTVIRMGN